MNADFPFNWDAVTAVASFITALGLVVVWLQIRQTSAIAQLQFEDALAREYRDLCTTIPSKVFLGEKLSQDAYEETFDEFYRYVDLSNEQVSLRKRGRVSFEVWRSWSMGIEQNLSLPAFSRAWAQIKVRTSSFQELRDLEASGFTNDPYVGGWHRLGLQKRVRSDKAS